jgi:hypothetical protein
MEKVKIDKDIKVLYVTARSFPDGIPDVVKNLHLLIPFSKERNIFGLSRPENGGEIVYRAAAEEMEKNEAEKLGCGTLIIKKGDYIGLTINDSEKTIWLSVGLLRNCSTNRDSTPMVIVLNGMQQKKKP